MATRVTLLQPQGDDYSHLEPLPDPPPREPDMQQRLILNAIAAMLMAHFAYRNDVLICGEGYLRNHATNASEVLVPDCIFVDGVNPMAIVRRNGYVISEVGKPPDLVIEVASRSTGIRDYTVKREGYAGYGVREYWRFDPSGGRFHDAALAGDALVDGVYVPLAIVHEPDGRMWGYSQVLGLELWWEDAELRFRDPATGEFLPTVEELQAAVEESQAAIEAAHAVAEAAHAVAETAQATAALARAAEESERTRREEAEATAQAERAAREAAEARLAELEAQLRHPPTG